MSEYGIAIFDTDGSTTLIDSNYATINVIDVNTVTGNGSINYSAWSDYDLQYSVIVTNLSLGHNVSFSGTTLNYTALTLPGDFDDYFNAAPQSIITVFAR
jgi:hypothetical protein